MNKRIHPSRSRLVGFSSFDNPHEMYPVVADIFSKTFPMLLAIGGVAVSISLYRSLTEPTFNRIAILHVAAYLTAILAFRYRKRLPLPVSFSSMLAIGYVLGIQSLFNLGLAGTGVMHCVIFCAFAGIFLGRKAGLITLAIGGFAIAVIGAGICSGVIGTKPGMDRYLLSPINWTIQVACFFTYLLPLVLSVNGLRKRMAGALGELKAKNEMLEAEITMRREVETRLRDSESRLRQVIDLVPHFIFAKDGQGRFVLVNRAVADAFGTTVEGLAGKTDADVHPHKDEVGWFVENDRRVMESGQALEIPEERITDSAGRTRFLHTIKIPFTISSTGERAVLGVCTDITDRKAAEGQLEESERRFRELADTLPQAVGEFDERGNFTFGNLFGCKMFGYTREEFDRGTFNVLNMIVPEDRERIKQNIASMLTNRKPSSSHEYSAIRKDGSRFPMVAYASPIIRDEQQKGFRAILVDITERKKIERELVESEAKYRSVVESSLVGFYIVQDGLFRFVNQRFSDMTGYAYEEVVDALGPADMAHTDDRTKMERNTAKGLAGQADHVEYDFRVIRKDGKVLTMKAFGNSISYNGRPAATGTVIDITREKHLESHLRRAEKMEAIGTLTGGIAHDFNNILTALIGYGSLLQIRMDDTDPLKVYADQILTAAHKASSLTRSLLTFGRQQPINLQRIDINNIIQGTRQLLNRLLTEDIRLETGLSPNDLTVMADATQIDQILFNLVTNARDSMPKGGTVIIETKPAVLDGDFVLVHGFGEPGKYALLSVSDTGMGMDAATKEKIFEPFFTTKETGKGTGLGLATVYGIVKQHNGYITVYSEPDMGSTFNIYLPVVKTGRDTEAVAASVLKRGKETILIAEDNDDVRRFTRDIFSLYGYHIIEAVDGEDAIDKFRKNEPIDLVVLDSVMPRKNGREAYDEIVKMRPDVKVLFMSGHTRDILLDKGIQEKEFAFISKPLSPNNLLQKVRDLLDA